MSTDKKTLYRRKLAQYAFVGGALGVYYGIFYKPGTEPDVGMAILLSGFAALVTVVVRSWRKKYALIKIVKDYLLMFLFFTIFMISITIRRIAYDMGGQPLVIAETVVSGVALGLLMAWQQFSHEVKK